MCDNAVLLASQAFWKDFKFNWQTAQDYHEDDLQKEAQSQLQSEHVPGFSPSLLFLMRTACMVFWDRPV